MKKLMRLFRWVRLLWKDEDWDYSYLLTLMEFKIKNMEKCFRKNGHHGGNRRIVRELKICRILIDRYLNKDYLNEKIFFGGTDVLWHTLDIGKDYPPEVEQEIRRRGKREDYMQTQDLNYLFSIMSRKLRTWWD